MEFDKLRNIIAEVLNVDPEEITLETTFMDDLGADSLDVFQIVMGIEEEFGIEIPAEKAEKISTVEEAVEIIKEMDKPKDKYDINELDEIYRNDEILINSYYLLNNPNERAFDLMTDEYLLNGIQKRINEIDNEQNVTFEYFDKHQKYAIQGTIKLNGVTYKYHASIYVW